MFELHRIVPVPVPRPVRWRVDSLAKPRPAQFFASRQLAEEYLTDGGAEYVAETAKWEGGGFDSPGETS